MKSKERIEQITIIVIAIVATLLSIADTFDLYTSFPLLSWAEGITPSLIVILLSMIAVYLVWERRSHLDKMVEITSSIEKKMGGAEIEILEMKRSFPQQLVNRVTTANKFILDTNFNQEGYRGRINGVAHPQEAYQKIRDERIIKGQLAFRRIEVVFTKDHLEKLVYRLLFFEGCDFYLRHYDAPPRAIPTMHLMSFDDEHFYMGGFYPSDPSTEERIVYIRNKEMGDLFREYWQLLWMRAIPLNEGKVINWDELRRIGARVGSTPDEFDALVANARLEINKERSKRHK